MPTDLFTVPWEKVGIVMLLASALIGVVKGWWVPGPYYVAMRAERDAALKKADDNNGLVERMLNVIEGRKQP